MRKLIINRERPFSFSKKIEVDYGKILISEEHQIAAKILEFSIDDLMFLDIQGEDIFKPSDIQEMVLADDYVPLDVFCARALYENKEAMWELRNLWSRFTVHAPRSCYLDSILFLGDTLINESKINHFATFKYQPMSDVVDFIPFEDDPFFNKNHDFILVFKKGFIQNL